MSLERDHNSRVTLAILSLSYYRAACFPRIAPEVLPSVRIIVPRGALLTVKKDSIRRTLGRCKYPVFALNARCVIQSQPVE